jgi:hypothetical protein
VAWRSFKQKARGQLYLTFLPRTSSPVAYSVAARHLNSLKRPPNRRKLDEELGSEPNRPGPLELTQMKNLLQLKKSETKTSLEYFHSYDTLKERD